MTLHIDSPLDRNARRRLARFFERAWESSDEYAIRARRARWDTYVLVVDEYAIGTPEADPHRLARRAMIAVGRTFQYSVA